MDSSSSATDSTIVEPTPSPVFNSATSASPITPEKTSSGRGKTVGLIIASILAVAGFSFGGYEFYQNQSQDTKISDLKVEVKNSDGSTTSLETDQISIDNTTSTVTISDSVPIVKNGVISDSDEGLIRSISTKAIIVPIGSAVDDEPHELDIDIRNGEIKLCRVRLNGSYDNTQEFSVNNLGGKISDVLVGNYGNGLGSETILFLMEDGSIEYVPIYKAWEEKNFDSRGKLPLSGIAVGFRLIDVGFPTHGGGIDTAIRLSDGSFQYLSDLIAK